MTGPLESLLENYTIHNGLPSAVQEGINQYTLSLAGFTIHIGWFEERGLILLHAGVALIPEHGRGELYARLLRANNMFADTSGLTLGIEPAERLVTLQAAWPLTALNNDGFNALLDNFILLSADWMRALSTFDADENALDTFPVTTDAATPGNMA